MCTRYLPLQEKYLHTNCLAALANLSSHFHSLHLDAARKIVKLVCLLYCYLTPTQARTYTHTHRHVHTHSHARIYTHTHTGMYTHTNTCTHTHSHTHTHTHSHTSLFKLLGKRHQKVSERLSSDPHTPSLDSPSPISPGTSRQDSDYVS